MLLLPECVEDYVAAENPVRFLDAFVAALDLHALSFARAIPAYTGAPAYAPGDLLRLYLYGYLHRVRSSRGLEWLEVVADQGYYNPATAGPR